ncbi:TIGR03620 family F420-dependent LLM class oxidoreductase [Amycolatopsis alkalitolerans]|uniref:TIGR03620 family F420-dependent LLM class oxidoreductase n=1 Tax=Amycolatopsis alkalitolerans TaxID=2547244 RepID=A0A5C4LYW4_9PSEU|nr:TIGR03620 family F420-dependent LLM class oxidoreductase [Amycolatopsis alkalitolerans]TNC24879.1 TIGR03620 family F420-dependent LLM class oxidoreductase [Amycolatopsis alkalitolerans]
MTKLGPIGAATRSTEPAVFAEVEALGYDTLWLPGELAQVAGAVRATSTITVTTGIVSVDQVPAAEVAAAYTAHGGRYLPGIGGAHGAKPLTTLNAYLDDLDPVVPASDRILSALGPKALKLAHDRAFAAYPFLVTPDYVAAAREIAGPDTDLAVLLMVVPETDPESAREKARGGGLRFLSGLPGYAASFRRMGFSDDEITGVADRLVDGVTVWGGLDAVTARLREYQAAGADQLVVQIDGLPANWRVALARAFGNVAAVNGDEH